MVEWWKRAVALSYFCENLMTRIYKYELALQHRQILNLPVGAKIRHIGVQNGTFQLWAEINPKNDVEPRTFIIYGTGHDIEENRFLEYLQTVCHNKFVWHFYELN